MNLIKVCLLQCKWHLLVKCCHVPLHFYSSTCTVLFYRSDYTYSCGIIWFVWTQTLQTVNSRNNETLSAFFPIRCFSSVQFSHSVVSNSLQPHESQHTRPPCPSPTPRVHSNSRPSSRWCHPAISSSVRPFSSCPQSLPASGSFPVSQLFAWGGQSIGSFSFNISPSNEHPGLISFRMDCWISLQSKGLSRVFSNTTLQKHQFFGAQLSLWSSSHIHR